MNTGEGYHIPLRKSTDQELVQWLVRKVDVEQIDLSFFSSHFVEHLYFNASHAITNHVPALNPEDFCFAAYRLLDSTRNNVYNQSLAETHEEFVYFILERKTGYILCNSPQLFMEGMVKRGIGPEEYENEPAFLMYYLDCIETYRMQYL